MTTRSIKLLRLITGERILSEVKSHEKYDNIIILVNPVRVMVVPSRTDPKTPSVGLAPFDEFTDDKEVMINDDKVLYIVEPITEFINQYNSMFGGIIVPEKKGLIVP